MKQAEFLRPLRKRLARLRRRRLRFRRATAFSALLVAVLCVLLGLFALDWCFQRNIDYWQRLVLTAIAAGGVIWAATRYVVPWLGKREDDADMALIVQGNAHIDSDLVAALQFESPEAARWGSPQLEKAVIERMAAQQGKIDVMSAMPREPLAFRLKLLAATCAVWAALGIVAPHYVAIFFQRLAFGSQHYPAQTELVTIKVNGKEVDLSAPGEAAIHVPYGRGVHIEVTAAGSRPDAGRAEVTTSSRSAAEVVPLEPAAPVDPEQTETVYQGDYAHLNQSAQVRVVLGDAWTEPLLLSVVPLPVVDIEAEVVLPVYAQHSAAAAIQKLPRRMRQFQVLLGSEVHLKLHTDRPLKAVQVKIAEQSFDMKRDEKQTGGEELWSLSAAGTPLGSVAAELSYTILVTDAEGQTPDKPLEGSITIEPDLPPVIAISTKSKVVLPTASPNIHYEASDDHALGQIWLTWEATSGDTSKPGEKREGRIDVCRYPPDAAPRKSAGDFALPMQSLQLAVGDTLRVTFHASDYRGPGEPAVADSDPPLVFQVTDLHGFEASMYEADQKSAEALENIRKKHTGEDSP